MEEETEELHVSAAKAEEPLECLARFERSVASIRADCIVRMGRDLQYSAAEPQVWIIADRVSAMEERAGEETMWLLHELRLLRAEVASVRALLIKTADDS